MLLHGLEAVLLVEVIVKGDAYLREEITKTHMALFYGNKVKERPLKERGLAP